jgi:hypothetical protein
MPNPTPRHNPASERLTHIRALWAQLQQTGDPKQRALLEQRIRNEAEAYKRATSRPFDK